MTASKTTIAAIIEQANLQAGIAPGATKITRAQHEKALSIARNLAIEMSGGEGAQLAERSRLKAITQHREAGSRRELAHYLAFETSMSADEAIKTLAAAPIVRKNLSVLDAMVVQLQSSGRADTALDGDLSAAIDQLVASRVRGSN